MDIKLAKAVKSTKVATSLMLPSDIADKIAALKDYDTKLFKHFLENAVIAYLTENEEGKELSATLEDLIKETK